MTNRVASYFSDSPGHPNVACPVCGWTPPRGTIWFCYPDGCGGKFDTFETHAKCPHCNAQFAWTACPVCGQASAHDSWYRSAS